MSRSYDYRADMLAAHEPKPAKRIPTPMYVIRLRALRRAMALREIASLGLTVSEAARVTGAQEAWIYKTAKRHGFAFVRVCDRDTPLERAVREAYAPDGIGPTRMAKKLGKSPKTLMVVACRLGLSDPTGDTHRFRRGFTVPAEQKAEYLSMTGVGCSPQEAGRILGLLPSDHPRVVLTADPRYSRGRPEARP